MKKIFAVVAVTVLGMTGPLQLVQAQNQNPAHPANVYAFENCKSGCVGNDTTNSVVYKGAVAKSYRFCSGDGYDIKVQVDAETVATRECIDVNGNNIVLISGKARIGRLPD